MKPLLLAAVVAVVAALFYGRHLGDTPIYLTKDEASFAIQSHAIATTGRDINGQSYPLFFQEPGFSVGRDPLYVYATALVLRVRPMDEGALRVPTTLAAIASIALTVLIARELFGGQLLPVVAGVLLAVTPAFFIRSRAALSVMLPVPFQLLWLLFLIRYARHGRLRDLLIATTAIGVGVYSYLSMLFFAPLHIGIAALEVIRRRAWRHAGIVAALFALMMVPLAYWQLTHPGRLDEIVSSYGLSRPGVDPLQRDTLTWLTVVTRADVYWGAFNPSRLFFSGESSLVDSTRRAGLFPFAYLLLLPLGLYALAPRWRAIGVLAIVVTLFLAPLPGTLIGEDTIGRYLIVCPLAALIAGAALQLLWDTRRVAARAMAAAAVVSALLLFRSFYVDYMTDWRARSALYLGGNLKGALEHVLCARDAPAPSAVYLSDRIPYADVYGEYYRRACNRDDLAGRIRGLTLGNDEWRSIAAGAIAIVPAGDDPSAATLAAGGWRVVTNMHEFYGGPPSFVVLSR